MSDTDNQQAGSQSGASGPPPLTAEGEQKTGTVAEVLGELERVAVARILFFDAKLNGPHDKGVIESKPEYEAFFRGKMREAQTWLDIINGLRSGKDIAWATPNSPR